MRCLHRLFLLLATGMLPIISAAAESLAIEQAWARATAPGQEVGAAYLTLRSTTNATLKAITTPAAGSVEIHAMSMDKGVMQMRKLDTLPLPAGKPVKLEPGGYHLMLIDLKKPLKAGDQLTFTLSLVDASGKPHQQQVRLPVKSAE